MEFVDLGHRLGVGLVTFSMAVVIMFWNFCGFLSWSSCYEEMFLIGGVVVAWLCQSLVVGSGFVCVGLGLIMLIWVCCDWFLDLGLIWVGLLTGFMGLICWEFGVDCVRSDDVGFDDLWGVEFGFFLLVFIYVLVIWVWVIRLLGLCSCDGFEFLVVGYDLEKEWRTSCKMKNNLNNMKNNLNSC